MSESLNNINNINSFAGMEFGIFKLNESTSEADMLQAAKTMEKEFLSKEQGFLGHGILKGENGTYADVAFATSQEKAESICAKWMDNEFARKYLEYIEPTSVNMSFWTRIK